MTDPRIILFTNHCPMCLMLKKALDESGIAYTVCEDLTEIMDKGFSHVPILKAGGQYMKAKEAMAWVQGLSASHI